MPARAGARIMQIARARARLIYEAPARQRPPHRASMRITYHALYTGGIVCVEYVSRSSSWQRGWYNRDKRRRQYCACRRHHRLLAIILAAKMAGATAATWRKKPAPMLYKQPALTRP